MNQFGHGRKRWLAFGVFLLAGLWVTPAMAGFLETVPTLSEWGMILLALSLATLATWQLAGRPALLHAAAPGNPRVFSRELLIPVLVGQGLAGGGLALYGALVEPLVGHDLVGAALSGVLLGIMTRCHRCERQHPAMGESDHAPRRGGRSATLAHGAKSSVS